MYEFIISDGIKQICTSTLLDRVVRANLQEYIAGSCWKSKLTGVHYWIVLEEQTYKSTLLDRVEKANLQEYI